MKQPLRPALPLLLVPLVFAWLGIVLSSELQYMALQCQPVLQGQEQAEGSALSNFLAEAVKPGAFVLCIFFAGTLVLRHKKKKKLSQVLLTLFAFSLALTSGNLFYAGLSGHIEQGKALGGKQELVVVEDTRQYPSSQGTEVLVRVQGGTELRLRAFWNEKELLLPKGSWIKATCSFTGLKENQRWLFDRGIGGTLTLANLENQGFSHDLLGAIDQFRHTNIQRIKTLGSKGEVARSKEDTSDTANELSAGEGRALLAGVLLGHRELLDGSSAEQDFITCGLSHLIAVSGSHLAILAALLSWLLRRLPLGRVSEAGVLLLVLVAYVVLTGLQPSAIRSAVMAGVAACSSSVGRRGHAPSALAAAALSMLLLYPPNAYSVGFWLSVFAVMGITLFSGLVTHWLTTALTLRPKADRPALGVKPLATSLALTLTAQAATLPLVLSVFGVFSLISPLANLLAAPLVSVVLVLGIFALALLPAIEPLGVALLKAAALLSEAATQLAGILASVPFASTPLILPLLAGVTIALVLAGFMYARWPLPRGKSLRRTASLTGIALLLIAGITPHFTPARLVVMDVGQGDALIVQEGAHTVLIDTGASEQALTHALARNHIKQVDTVVITHLDNDHGGALKRLRGLVVVGEVLFAEGLAASNPHDSTLSAARELVGSERVGEVACGEELRLGATLGLTVLWPEHRVQEGGNAESICLLLGYDQEGDGTKEHQVLLTGDAEEAELEQILKTTPSLRAATVKLGHHGSSEAVSAQQLQQLGVKVALISVGENNRYGHPAPKTLDILKENKVATFRTDEQGDLTLSFKGAILEVRCATMVPVQ